MQQLVTGGGWLHDSSVLCHRIVGGHFASRLYFFKLMQCFVCTKLRTDIHSDLSTRSLATPDRSEQICGDEIRVSRYRAPKSPTWKFDDTEIDVKIKIQNHDGMLVYVCVCVKETVSSKTTQSILLSSSERFTVVYLSKNISLRVVESDLPLTDQQAVWGIEFLVLRAIFVLCHSYFPGLENRSYGWRDS
jgi:hypothetical protein